VQNVLYYSCKRRVGRPGHTLELKIYAGVFSRERRYGAGNLEDGCLCLLRILRVI